MLNLDFIINQFVVEITLPSAVYCNSAGPIRTVGYLSDCQNIDVEQSPSP
jgi:hypothetical protein